MPSTTPARIGLLGDLDTAKPTHRELVAAVDRFGAEVQVGWLPTDEPAARSLDGLDGLWVLPGSPYRDDATVLAALAWALESGTPMLGTCGGFQYALLMLADRLAGLDAAHAELDPDAADPLVAPTACSLVGEEREVRCVPGTALAAILGTEPFTGFHWCNYGLSDAYFAPLEAAGVRIAAHAPDAGVEAVEVPGHPFFVATLFQPQAGASAGRPQHPLITAFLGAAAQHAADR